MKIEVEEFGEAGTMTVTRRDSGGRRYDRSVAGPEAGARWEFEIETMPLLRPQVQPERKEVRCP